MSDDDLDELAQRYLDLWQDQASALAADPGFGEALRRLVETGLGSAGEACQAWTAWQEALAAQLLRAAGATTEEDGRHEGRGPPNGQRRTGAARGTRGSPAAAAAPGRGGGDLDHLARRLAAMEERIAELERGLGDAGQVDGPAAARAAARPTRRARRPAAPGAPRRRT
ncbi:MAG: hypothetical protein WD341_01375 [Tistlia sp.]|uniref:hypothetical protein n=1 Tax=Tistlia sp. TaxID=3057121 RepID=UPI0034A188B1